ncbi:hypothetical protein AVEN_158473-1 [Araneus ventricosus]|uniref:Uncharacterized protein n=1 Tax=Araneus ventricosus TaxID=182803 RepID=A0A4Y2KZS5_ARAVE|nr:hypothetical protein AVEN_158473-1 [Araneus ventricosus]
MCIVRASACHRPVSVVLLKDCLTFAGGNHEISMDRTERFRPGNEWNCSDSDTDKEAADMGCDHQQMRLSAQ